MANTLRWRYGETHPVVMAVEAGTVIEVGDLVYIDHRGCIRPASHALLAPRAGLDVGLTPTSEMRLLQEVFHDAFVGVALQQSRDGQVEPIRVATMGVFCFDVEERSTFQVGQLIGPQFDPLDQRLVNQAVLAVPTENLAIGRCAKRELEPRGVVLVDIVSTLMYGGPQAAA